jgi:hypothetical protein
LREQRELHPNALKPLCGDYKSILIKMKQIIFFQSRLKNPILTIALFLIFCCATGCLNIVEEIWLNEDQSGRYQYTLDMSEMLKTTENMVRSMGGSIDSTNHETQLYQDTTISLSDLPDSIKQKFKNPQIFEHLKVRFLKDISSRTALVTYSFEFRKVSEIAEFWDMMHNLKVTQPKGFASESKNSASGLFGIPPIYTFQNDTFIRTHITLSDAEMSLLKDYKKQADNPFIKSMMEHAVYKITVHFPNSVINVDGAAVSSQGNKVEVSVPLLDLAKDVEKLNFQAKID